MDIRKAFRVRIHWVGVQISLKELFNNHWNNISRLYFTFHVWCFTFSRLSCARQDLRHVSRVHFTQNFFYIFLTIRNFSKWNHVYICASSYNSYQKKAEGKRARWSLHKLSDRTIRKFEHCKTTDGLCYYPLATVKVSLPENSGECSASKKN